MKNSHRLNKCLPITIGVLFSISLFVATNSGKAEELVSSNPVKKRPKICLVLSGGGARGSAHVGVLKVLEEYRVPIDCITGTSMGSLVGAAYATGMTLPEMDKVMASISSELLFKEKPPRQELSMRRKQDDYKSYFGPEFGVGDGELKLPKGVVSGVQLETVLRRLAKVPGYYKFDDLPIPFRAVATDLVTGKAVVFSEGELANVMRASMSVPGAVAPAEFGGMLLVDGMLTSNLPVQEARDMGADIVIAVNVGTPLLKREQLNGILGVTGQMLSILTEQNVQAALASLKPTDVLITPELGDYSTGDFDSLPKISPLGAEAARKVADKLKLLSLSPSDYAAFRQGQSMLVKQDLRHVDEIRFDKMERVNPVAAQTVMETKVGEPIDQEVLDRDMRRLYGTGDFEHVSYRLIDEADKRVLVVDAAERTAGPDYTKFGLGLSSDFAGDAYFNLLGSYRKTWLNPRGAEWRTDVQIGRDNLLSTEFYQPLDETGYFFVAPHASWERSTADLYRGDDRVATYDTDSRLLGFDIGSAFSRYGEMRLGIEGGVSEPTLDTGPQTLSPANGSVDRGAFTGRIFLDQLDSVHFPRVGWRAAAEVYNSTSTLLADEDYTKWEANGMGAYSFGKHTLNLSLTASGPLGSDELPRYDLVQWGGFLRQSGYAADQLLGEELVFGRVMYYHRVLEGSILEGAYGGISLEVGKVGNPLVAENTEDWLKSSAVFLAADTPIGPAYLGYGRAEDGNDSFYFYLGMPY